MGAHNFLVMPKIELSCAVPALWTTRFMVCKEGEKEGNLAPPTGTWVFFPQQVKL